jgi:hypothetical protein
MRLLSSAFSLFLILSLLAVGASASSDIVLVDGQPEPDTPYRQNPTKTSVPVDRQPRKSVPGIPSPDFATDEEIDAWLARARLNPFLYLGIKDPDNYNPTELANLAKVNHRKLSLMWHSDKTNHPRATEVIQLINAAKSRIDNIASGSKSHSTWNTAYKSYQETMVPEVVVIPLAGGWFRTEMKLYLAISPQELAYFDVLCKSKFILNYEYKFADYLLREKINTKELWRQKFETTIRAFASGFRSWIEEVQRATATGEMQEYRKRTIGKLQQAVNRPFYGQRIFELLAKIFRESARIYGNGGRYKMALRRFYPDYVRPTYGHLWEKKVKAFWKFFIGMRNKKVFLRRATAGTVKIFTLGERTDILVLDYAWYYIRDNLATTVRAVTRGYMRLDLANPAERSRKAKNLNILAEIFDSVKQDVPDKQKENDLREWSQMIFPSCVNF